MPREHAAISLTADEIVHFISGQTHCFVGTVDPDGSPWADVAACAYHDGRLWFRLSAGSRSLRNVMADPRVCCTLESEGDDYYDNISAMIHGEASALEEGASLAELDALADPVAGKPIAGSVYSVDLENVVSFDFAKIQRRFSQA